MKEVYGDLLKNGWTMTAIDDMDVFYYFETLAYNKVEKKQMGFIDDIF